MLAMIGKKSTSSVDQGNMTQALMVHLLTFLWVVYGVMSNRRVPTRLSISCKTWASTFLMQFVGWKLKSGTIKGPPGCRSYYLKMYFCLNAAINHLPSFQTMACTKTNWNVHDKICNKHNGIFCKFCGLQTNISRMFSHVQVAAALYPGHFAPAPRHHYTRLQVKNSNKSTEFFSAWNNRHPSSIFSRHLNKKLGNKAWIYLLL